MIGPGWHWDRQRACMEWIGVHDVTPLTRQDPSRPGWWMDELGDHYIQPPVGAPLCPVPGGSRNSTVHWLDGPPDLPAGIVSVPATLGIFTQSGWYYVAAYDFNPVTNEYRRLYARGPMWLTSSMAETEFFNTVDSFWSRAVFMWRWSNGRWTLVNRI